MKISATLTILVTLAVTTPTWAGDSLPEATSRRVILHGVDCSISDGTVCDEERPVFDEAIASVPSTADLSIQSQVLDSRGGEPARALPRVSADAVRDYFIGGGIAPEQIEIEGSSDARGFVDGQVPIDVQLSSSGN